MDVLPLEKIRDEDGPLVGQNIVYLARLSRMGLPVARALVVLAPEIKLKTILKKYDLAEREIFEQSLAIVKKEIEQIPVPEELKEAFASDKQVDVKVLWRDLLGIWLDELRSRIWREGFNPNLTEGFSAQTVFLTETIAAGGKAWFEQDSNEIHIEIEQGSLTEKQSDRIRQIVIEGNKKLLLPQVYYWLVDRSSPEPQISKLIPYSGKYLSQVEEAIFPLEEKKPEALKQVKSVTSVYLDLSSGLLINREVDGVIIMAERVSEEVNGIKDKFEAVVFRLVEAALAFPESPVILKLSDKIEHRGGVRGSLRLIHQESLLREETEAFLFARNKKNLLNVAIAVPFVRSVNEFMEMKRLLSSKGVSRKGSLKLWLEMSVPENIINIDEYLVAGCDGVILNLDELAQWIGGFDTEVPESVFYQKQISALTAFLEAPLKSLHQMKIPVLATGSLSLNDEVLEFLIARGIKGVVADSPNAASLWEHLRFVEKRLIRKRAG